MTPRRFYNPQFDLFLPNIVDLKFRDQKDTMERPFFSLSKSKRMKPIEYHNDNDGIFVTVQPHQDYGMATIWDADVLIWAASVLSDMKNRGMNDIPRELKFQPHDLLRVIGRTTGGKDYAQLRGSLDRLKSHDRTAMGAVPRGRQRRQGDAESSGKPRKGSSACLPTTSANAVSDCRHPTDTRGGARTGAV